MVIKEVSRRFFLPGPHGGRHCAGQKLQVFMFPIQGPGDSDALVGRQKIMVVKAYPRQQEALDGDILW